MANKSSESEARFKQLGKAMTNQNCFHEELMADVSQRILATIGLGIFLSLHFQSQIKNISIYRTVIFPGVIYGWKTWPSYEIKNIG